MDQLVAVMPPPLASTEAAVQALERLRHDLGTRHRIPGGRITANAGTAVLVLDELTVWCHRGADFTWSGGRDERNRAILAKAPVSELGGAAERIAARYREIHGYQPAPARRTG
ncbi:hypothetical protein [Microbispora sp. CSR-4]|uniref:hypothetical protein n=1 Tax=Microbispora sp. CSR-4 TaxID=2592813 RepID=UPI0011CBAEA6|nr:hypothetical protein [Microbispora sp. CSR-4]